MQNKGSIIIWFIVTKKKYFPKWMAVFSLAMIFGIMGHMVTIHHVRAETKSVVGWIEKVLMLPENIVLHAKIDTGADNSSLNINEIEEFTHSRERWVRFSFETREGGTHKLEKPVYRYTRIKRKGAEPQKRPVVLFDLCLGSVLKKDVEVNLADRTGFKYNMLMGRSFLSGSTLVDSEKTYTQTPLCLNE